MWATSDSKIRSQHRAAQGRDRGLVTPNTSRHNYLKKSDLPTICSAQANLADLHFATLRDQIYA